MLIGSPLSDQQSNYFVKVLNLGTTMDTSTPKDFHNWDELGFKKNVLLHFVRFLSQSLVCIFYLTTTTGADSVLSLLLYFPNPRRTLTSISHRQLGPCNQQKTS